MEDILFVTAYKEIGREQWELFPRSSEEYIRYFYNLVDAIEYKLVVYVEDKIRKIFAGHVFKDNIIIKDLNEVDTFYNKFIDKEREIITRRSESKWKLFWCRIEIKSWGMERERMHP
jgi:hypothetical protein